MSLCPEWIKTAEFLAQFGMVHIAGSWKWWLHLSHIIRTIQEGCIRIPLLPPMSLSHSVPASLTHYPSLFFFHSTPFCVFCYICFVGNTNVGQIFLDLPILLDLSSTTLFLKQILLFSRHLIYLVLFLPFWSLISFLSFKMFISQWWSDKKNAPLSNKFSKYYMLYSSWFIIAY